MFYGGLDLGQAQDYTALLAIEQHQLEDLWRYDVRHIERFPLGTPYPTIVTKVGERMSAPQLRGVSLVIDGTGCGRPVVDMFVQTRLNVVPVLITGGAHTHKDEETGYWMVPKRDLVATVQVLLQSKRLKIADALPEARALTAELLSFQAKITTAANDVYGAWREGQHDDLVLGLALALWWAERGPSWLLA